MDTVTERKRGFYKGHERSYRPTSETAIKAWETKRAKEEHRARMEVERQKLEAVARVEAAAVISASQAVADLVRDATGPAVEFIASVVQNPEETTDTRLKAAGMLVAQGWGSAPKKILSTNLDFKLESRFSDRELAEMARRFFQQKADPSLIGIGNPAIEGDSKRVQDG